MQKSLNPGLQKPFKVRCAKTVLDFSNKNRTTPTNYLKLNYATEL